MSRDPADHGDTVTREEWAALVRRVYELEQRLRALGEPVDDTPVTAAEPKPPAPAPDAPRPEPARPLPPPTPPAPRPAPQAPAAPVSLETVLGERWAPRIGAVLVFLAAIFFLGLGIERGWVTPPMQLAIAALFAAGLLGGGAWLTERRGYGTYPQVLEATGACVLYLTAFVAHAIPYYQRATGLTETGGGFLMALVAAGTVGLALHRDARVIAGLGYLLAFLTAGLGFDILPGLTLAYVAVLGASLALVVAARGWAEEALGGVLLTGGFLLGFAMRSTEAGDPSAWAVVTSGALPFAAFTWLTLRAVDARERGFAAAVAVANLAWAVLASLVLLSPDLHAPTAGRALLAWCALAAGLAVAAARIPATARGVPRAYGLAAVLLYLAWPPFLYADSLQAGFATTATYAAGALALSLAAGRPELGTGRGPWTAGLALGAAAALHAVLVEARPFFGGTPGTWEAWATLLLLAPAFALLVARDPRVDGDADLHRAAFGLGVAFLAVWAFALFTSPFLVTAYLVLVGGLLVAAALTVGGTALLTDALLAGSLLVLLAAGKAAAWDAHAADLPPTLATLDALLVAGALLALYHVGLTRGGRLAERARELGVVLVGGSALVLASFLVAYAAGAWVSVALAILGVLYLGTGFGLTNEPAYRWTGFGLLGFVVLRVFAVDLANADLAVRALVFLALGGILLGVGYAYARARRDVEPDASDPEPLEPAPK